MATFTVAPPAVGQLGGAGGTPFPSSARCPQERPLCPDQGGSHPGPAVNGHSQAVGKQRLHPGRPSCRHTRCPSSLGTGAPPGPDTGHLHSPATLCGHGGKPLPSRSLPPRLSPTGTLCPPSSDHCPLSWTNVSPLSGPYIWRLPQRRLSPLLSPTWRASWTLRGFQEEDPQFHLSSPDQP